ncbi:XRE family transcriptional regulator [Sphingomonas sp. ABOLG]|uniref:XRE family transcriptional regulator n=1 Tax=Sphingomonas sp. ABOLG TaxID=1985880 RepID=UPI000F7F2E79|nr:XRE family transcriptional regulator [Sphingomonas sp. ABOLG]RSV20531.1 XRE family transcriptional regulator [Sphingomonas sp. ABOLG]
MDINSPDIRTPGQLIEALLNERGWNKRTLAVVLAVDEATVNRWISDKQAVNASIAISLEEVLDAPAERFLELQRAFDLAKARFAQRPDPGRRTRAQLFGSLPVAAMIKRGWIDASDVRDIAAVERGLTKFFGVERVEQIEVMPHAARKTEVNREATPTQIAWLNRVRSIADELIVPPFNVAALERALPRLHQLAVAAEEARHVPRILAECGIRFVIVEALPSAKIDGVCFWLDDASPVVGLSMRHDRIDNFWFVLRHELEHVRLGHGRLAMILDDLEGERSGTGADIPEEERLANSAAQEFCVPSSKMDSFVARKAPFFSERDMTAFAKLLGVHAGLVAGQLQHRTGRYDRFRQHLVGVRTHIRANAAVDGWGDVYPLGE